MGVRWPRPAAAAPAAATTADVIDYIFFSTYLEDTQDFLQRFIREDIPRERALQRLMDLGGQGFSDTIDDHGKQLQKTQQFVVRRRAASRNSPEVVQVLDQLQTVQRLFSEAAIKCKQLVRNALEVAAARDAQAMSAGDDGGQSTDADQPTPGTSRVRRLRQTDRLRQDHDDLDLVNTDDTTDSSEDEEADVSTPTSSRSIEDWISDGDHRKRFRLTVDRRDPQLLLAAVLSRYMATSDRRLSRPIMIQFAGERGIDRGGLSREFFFAVFDAVRTSKFKGISLFEGQPGHLLPNVLADQLTDEFETLGRMVVHAVRSGCRGLPGLSPAVKQYLVRGSGMSTVEQTATPYITIDDVTNNDLRDIIRKIQNGECLSEEMLLALRNFLSESNCPLHVSAHSLVVTGTAGHQELSTHSGHAAGSAAGQPTVICQSLLFHHVFKSRATQLDALMKGLDCLELRKFLGDNPSEENIAFVFPSMDDMESSPDNFMARVKERGNNVGLETFNLLRQFLDDLHRGNIPNKRIGDVVQFLSGSPYLPPDIVISVDASIQYPMAHACFSELVLPTGLDCYDDFKNAMMFSLQHGTAFSSD